MTGVVLVHYGSPHTGRHLVPFAEAASALGARLIAVPRPGYADAPRIPDRDVVAAARLALDHLDWLGVDRFATLGYSGGGPHALAVAALAGVRVTAVATFASPAPYDGTPEWLDGIRDRRGLEAALVSREVREEHERAGAFDPGSFTPSDLELLEGAWADLGADAQAASGGLGPADDDRAFVRPWGVDLAEVRAPVAVVHGDEDRIVPFSHAERLTDALPQVDLQRVHGAGHIGVLERLPSVLAALLRVP